MCCTCSHLHLRVPDTKREFIVHTSRKTGKQFMFSPQGQLVRYVRIERTD